MTALDPFQPEQCRLMSSSPELIQRHNQLAAVLAQVRDQLPMVWTESTVVEDLLPFYRDVRAIVARSHYRVGFIGGSQAGKSSTFNSVLGFQQGADDSPATGGAARATTSATTRLRRTPVAAGARPHCVSRYMNRTQLDKRLDSLLKEYNVPELGVWDGDARRLLEATQAALVAARERAASSQRAPRSERASLIETKAGVDDLEYLERYLQALLDTDSTGVAAIDRIIRDPAVEQPFPYEERESFINHQPGGGLDDKLLQREVEVHFPTESISDRLEMIDLPGLNAKLVADTVLTTEFITEELDATVVFLRSDEVAPKPFFKVMDLFKKHFQNEIADRVWLVVTKVDTLTKDHLPLDDERESMLDNLVRSLNDTSIPHEHTYFTSNTFYTSHVEARSRGDADPDQESRLWGQGRGVKFNAGTPDLPASWAKGNDVLEDAFRQVFDAGGIAQVRKLLQSTIAEKVERRIRTRCDLDLREIARRFAGVVEATKSLMSQDPTKLVHAAEWVAKVQEARTAVRGDFQRFEPPARELRDDLLAQFGRICGPKQRIPPEQLPAKHDADTRSLLLSAELILRKTTMPTLAELAGELLKNGPPDVAVWGHKNPYEAWKNRQPQNEEQWRKVADASYVPVIATLMSTELFPSTHLANFMNLAQYRTLMQEKIRVMSHQVLHASLLFLDRQLAEMEEQLSLIQRGTGKLDMFSGGPPPEVFDKLSQELRQMAEGVSSPSPAASPVAAASHVASPAATAPVPPSRESTGGKSDGGKSEDGGESDEGAGAYPRAASTPSADWAPSGGAGAPADAADGDAADAAGDAVDRGGEEDEDGELF